MIMRIPKNTVIKSPVFFKKAVVPDQFSLLCWNIHKENLKKNFKDHIQAWKAYYALDFVLLQEAHFYRNLFSVAGFPFVAVANLKYLEYFSGVLTAAGADPVSYKYKITLAKEAYITRKASLITVYDFNDRTRLMVVNIHAINFSSASWYQWEMSRLFNLIKHHQGPLILAGDFNCWQKKRKEIVNALALSLGLEHSRPRFPNHIKQWFGHRLDRLYWRDLTLLDMQALDCKTFSDHNPIIAKFIYQA